MTLVSKAGGEEVFFSRETVLFFLFGSPLSVVRPIEHVEGGEADGE